MTFPHSVQINAWANGEVRGAIDPDLGSRILGLDVQARSGALPAPLVSETEWQHEDVGWGLILPENLDIAAKDRSTSIDAPESIRDLHAARGGPVFRVGPDWTPGVLRRYAPDGGAMDVVVGASATGTGPGRIPRYLLIVGGPDVIPWEVQYDLHHAYFVGRLALDDAGLKNYVEALLSGWSDRPPNPGHSLVWSVDHHSDDITNLMRKTIGLPMHKRFVNDTDAALRAGALMLDRVDATHAKLRAAVESHRPGLIVTTSHGETWPLTNTHAMRRHLGLLIDANEDRLDPAALTGVAAPSGAVWFAQACCSAGSTATSGYEGILRSGSTADTVLRAVAACGDTVAPLPRALLGGTHPLAALVGHVEPTFDWSIAHRETGQYMTYPLLLAFHQQLFTGHPIGMALKKVRETGASFLSSYDVARRLLSDDDDETQLGNLLAVQLAARDWQSIVLLGDPTVTVYP